MNVLSPNGWLLNEFSLRKERNHRYSVRRFSSVLGLSPGAVSEILSSKRRITLSTAKRIAQGLSLAEVKAEQFFDLVRVSKKALPTRLPNGSSRRLQADHFATVADWYHFALLSLLETSNFIPNKAHLASRLGITPQEASDALERLARIGLIKQLDDGSLKPAYATVRSPSGVPSKAVRSSHRQILAKALDSLESSTVDMRDFSAMTLAIDPENIGKAKEILQRFRRRFSNAVETGDRRSLYIISMQFFPASPTEGKHAKDAMPTNTKGHLI